MTKFTLSMKGMRVDDVGIFFIVEKRFSEDTIKFVVLERKKAKGPKISNSS